MSAVLIIGASLAGLTAAETLRSDGFDDELIVVDPSATLPPDRPPLSKQVLSGEWEPERAAHRAADRLAELQLDLRLGVAATSLHALTRRVELSDGTAVDAAGIVLATGAEPRALPGPSPAGVHLLRTMADCLALRADLDDEPSRVAVIGAGFIGAEVAATCRGRGLAVTMIEAGDVPLGRVLPPPIGEYIADLHRQQGVDVRLGVGVDGFASNDGRVSGVRLSNGEVVEADVVVVGIGVAPSTDWLAGSGLELDDGVRCDETCSAAPGIVAAGDVANWPNLLFGERMRVEQWENAIQQGEHAARRLLVDLGIGGSLEPFRPVPWFWSDQYDRKLQMAGRPGPDDELVVLEGGLGEPRFAALSRRGDRCTAVIGVDRPRHVMQARMKMADSLDFDSVADVFG